MAVVKREGNRITLDWTLPVVLWTCMWLLLALAVHSGLLLIIALIPFMLMMGWILLTFCLTLIVSLGLFLSYLSGKPIVWTNKYGRKKVFQRKRR